MYLKKLAKMPEFSTLPNSAGEHAHFLSLHLSSGKSPSEKCVIYRSRYNLLSKPC